LGNTAIDYYQQHQLTKRFEKQKQFFFLNVKKQNRIEICVTYVNMSTIKLKQTWLVKFNVSCYGFKLYKVSVSPTFYDQLFYTKVVLAALMYFGLYLNFFAMGKLAKKLLV